MVRGGGVDQERSILAPAKTHWMNNSNGAEAGAQIEGITRQVFWSERVAGSPARANLTKHYGSTGYADAPLPPEMEVIRMKGVVELSKAALTAASARRLGNIARPKQKEACARGGRLACRARMIVGESQ